MRQKRERATLETGGRAPLPATLHSETESTAFHTDGHRRRRKRQNLKPWGLTQKAFDLSASIRSIRSIRLIRVLRL
ncbi:hypothetical protein GEOBRER4_n3371 [Citrifermentans bremense]|uniref:Uncharacterized protein n=1 Tax=Citrifermentans bremense TaxID=60035 RepID=A0A7R7FTH6_9BACT|nr:hypothetical protein GEOBRER4_n3371 [Citrifermentans bremense]